MFILHMHTFFNLISEDGRHFLTGYRIIKYLQNRENTKIVPDMKYDSMVTSAISHKFHSHNDQEFIL